MKITDIAHFTEIAGDFIKTLSPHSQFLDNRILLKIPNAERKPYEGVWVYEMEIIVENDRIDVSLWLISSDIEYKDGMIEDKNNVRIMGYGSIIGLKQPQFAVSLLTLENRVKAMVKHNVFTYNNISNNYVIKQDFMPLALDICRKYQVRLDHHQCSDVYSRNTDSILKSIDEPWLNNPSDSIFDPSILKCITLNDINTY